MILINIIKIINLGIERVEFGGERLVIGRLGRRKRRSLGKKG